MSHTAPAGSREVKAAVNFISEHPVQVIAEPHPPAGTTLPGGGGGGERRIAVVVGPAGRLVDLDTMKRKNTAH